MATLLMVITAITRLVDVMIVIIQSISEISSCFFGPRLWHIEIRHRVKKTSTMNLFGFETLKLKNRILKLWKPGVAIIVIIRSRGAAVRPISVRRFWISEGLTRA